MASRKLMVLYQHRLSLICVVIIDTILLLFCGTFAGAQTQNPTQLPGQSGPPAPSAPLATAPGAAPTDAPGIRGTPNPQQGSAPPVSQAPLGGVSGLGADSGNLQFVELRAFSNLTRVTGEARDRSFLTPGNNNNYDFSYFQNLTRGVHRFELVSVGRYTDDARVDPEHSSLQRAYFRLSAPHYELNFGDYLVSYSRFTYNQNLKGLHFIRGWGNFRILGNAGTFTDRYGSLFKEDLPGKPFTRIVSGVRAEQKLGRDKLLALTWSYGNDIANSVPIDPVLGREPFVPVHNNVVSLESRMTFFRNWNMQGELAYSDTNPDTRFSSDNRKDYAVRFDNTLRAGSWNFSEYYTRMMPSFFAINARQVADLQDIMFRASNQLSSRVTAQVSYRRTNDDLRQQNPNPRTVFQLPEARLSFRDLPGLGATLLDFGYRERHQQQAQLASRISRAPFVEVGVPISSSVLTISFEHRANIDRRARAQQTSANDISASFRSIFNLGDWMFTPLARWELNREIFDRVATGNANRNIQGGLILETPKWFVLEGMYREIGATLFQDQPLADPVTRQPVINANGLQSFEVTGPSGFRRPSAHFAITYKIGNNENRTMALSYDRNRNYFALPGQNFFERVFQITLLWRFRKM